MAEPDGPAREGEPTGLRRVAPWLAFAGLAILLWLYVASVLLAPWWGVGVLVVLWVLLLALTVRWARTHPLATLVVPVLGVALWVGVISAGEAWFGWTA